MFHFGPMSWKHLLAYITDSVDQELLLRNEYLATENRVFKYQIKTWHRSFDPKRFWGGTGI
jgi:putative transposase